MTKFRERPVVLEAVQWFKHGDHPHVHATGKMIVTTGLGDNYAASEAEFGLEGCGFIHTPEGDHIVTPGDWIITGVKGEHYACKPDIFAELYEPA